MTLNAVPLGETAVLVACADETAAANLAQAARLRAWPWLIDVVQAYASVAVFFERDAFPASNRHRCVIAELTALDAKNAQATPRHHVIPVCYEKSLDLDRVAQHTGLDADAVIRSHTSTTYTVYAIGFCPGFPYLGYLPPELSGVPRLATPRVRVVAGSVGMTGRQTGIYTEPRPGGWNIIGQTPLELVNVEDDYFPLETGDTVSFQRIDEREFERLKGERLMVSSRLSAGER